MSKDRKRRAPAPKAEPPPTLNTPFLLAKQKLAGLVKPPPDKGPKSPAKKAPAVPTPLPPQRQQSDEELFQQEMWGVRRIESSSERAEKNPSARQAPPRPSEDAEVYAELADLVDGIGPWDIADSDEYIEGIGPGLDRRLLLRLRKGDYAIQGHLDLHGLTSEEAHERVDKFIQQSRLSSKRCVLIIHGRGINSKDQVPVLKGRIQVWLSRGRIAKSVLCFATARPVDGGAGAVYVLLRR